MQKLPTPAKNNPNAPLTFEVKDWNVEEIEKLETAEALRATLPVIFYLRFRNYKTNIVRIQVRLMCHILATAMQKRPCTGLDRKIGSVINGITAINPFFIA